MRIPLPTGLKSISSAAEIRGRFKGLVNANLLFFGAVAIVSILSEVFSYGEAAIVGAIPIFVLYLVSCIALGRLAACFGQNSTSWAASAFVFYLFVLAIAVFVFGDGVRRAYSETS